MIDLERELRALLEEDARHAPPAPEARAVLRRTRRRQVGVVLTTLAVVAAVAVGSVAGVSALIRSSERRIPIGPTETPMPSPTAETTTPSPTALAPAVISGSGLDGYVATTFPGAGNSDLAIAPDGAVWAAGWASVSRFDDETWTAYYGPEDGLPRGYVLDVEVTPDGSVWAGTERGLARLDGRTWTIVSPSVWVRDLAVAPDGSVVTGFYRPLRNLSWGGVARFDGETWSILGDADTMPEDFLTFLDVSPVDGAVWTTAGGSGFIPVGTISRFDGSVWTGWSVNEFPGHEELPGLIPQAMTVGPDGSVWVVTLQPETLHHGWRTLHGTLARFDGVTWTVFSAPVGAAVNAWGVAMAIGPDGTVWLAGNEGQDVDEYRGLLFSFDGTSWTRDRVGGGVSALEVAPDGTLWVVVDGSLVRFTPVNP